MGSKMSWNFISTIFKFYMSEKNIEFIQDPQKSIHYIGHEIVIYFFSNKLQITMAGAKKNCQIIRNQKGWLSIATLPVR